MQDFLETEDEQEEELSLYEHYRIVVDKGQSLVRIDKFLTDKLANVTRNKIQEAIKQDFVKVNEKKIKPNYKVKPLDVITIAFPTPPRNTEIIPQNIPLDIVFEDEFLLVVNKPAGMVVHPAHGNWQGTLVNALAYHFQQLPSNADGKPGLVHRIDKDTSGLLVIAKTEQAMTHLAKQFFHHTIERIYYALVWGEPTPLEGTIRTQIGRSPKDRRVFQAFTDESIGKSAITHYKVLQSFRYVSLVECRLETGRTHQIRVHFKYIGHPLFNDATYGGDKILKGMVFSKYKAFVENCFAILPRHALHAKSLGFVHPVTQEKMFFDSELPQDFKQVLQKWENYIRYEK
ncbi:MAG: RluA family pseudouridine synthase [Microscillaceae bacterium]|nr:RluA family pseudouridine synthase [Microscillaceae bacterium]MDW8460123.1 RluA family pseudouridine synthase [Cytophagales bacterium]